MSDIQKVIGLMSGTSLDGVDAALLDTDGEDFVRPGPGLTVPYDAPTRTLLRAALDTAREVAEGAPVPHSIREAERRLTEAHAETVQALLKKAGLSPDRIALIGFHGQTILHRPERRWTWQIGDGALLARLTGIDVVNDFRSADVKAGGQGAPLVPLYHAALLRSFSPFGAKYLEGGDAVAGSGASEGRGGSSLSSPFGTKYLEGGDAVAGSGASEGRGGSPIAVINIGGVGNVTYIKDDLVLAFDTGPGNAPVDDWMQHHTGKPLDQDGAFARMGRIDDAALSKMLANPYFDRVPPKSLDRMDFGVEAVRNLSAADGAATLTAFTAATIARAGEHFPEPAATWIVCGGGRHNSFLMDQLRAQVNAPVLKAEDAGWDGDALEAQAFGYLAVRSRKGLPLSLPTTTGVKQPMTGGKFYRRH